MCIAIVKPAGKWVSKDALANSFRANPNGAGYAYIKDDKVVIKKGFFDFEAFFKAYSKDVTTSTIAIAHFRIATRGPKDEANCHPFAIDHGALMHNGPCLNYKHCNGDKDRSDSRQFAEDMVKNLPYETIKAILPIISGFAGSEKIAFLFDNGEFLIANEAEGLWSEGCWYSNSSFRGYFNTGGSAIRNDNWAGSYHHQGAGTTSGATGGQGSTAGTTRAPANLAAVIKRSFGHKMPLFDCKWSIKLQDYVPVEVMIDNTHLVWDDVFAAFVPIDVTNQMCSDKRYVYEATNFAQKQRHGPRLTVDQDWVVVADVLQTSADLKAFLSDAQPVPETTTVSTTTAPTEPNTGVTPGQEGIKPVEETKALTTEVAPATSNATDASVAKTAETIH
jgi:hypothetical protein